MKQWLQKRPIQPAQEQAPQKLGPSSGISNQAVLSMLEGQDTPAAPRPASGGTPLDKAMQAKIERQFGLPMGDVRIHRNSDEPAKFDAGAYTYGTDIFIGPGQENTLEHELTHVAQQKLGQVRPTGQEHGLPVNRDPALEHSAEMGFMPQMGRNEVAPVIQCCGNSKKENKRGRESATPSVDALSVSENAGVTTTSVPNQMSEPTESVTQHQAPVCNSGTGVEDPVAATPTRRPQSSKTIREQSRPTTTTPIISAPTSTSVPNADTVAAASRIETPPERSVQRRRVAALLARFQGEKLEVPDVRGGNGRGKRGVPGGSTKKYFHKDGAPYGWLVLHQQVDRPDAQNRNDLLTRECEARRELHEIPELTQYVPDVQEASPLRPRPDASAFAGFAQYHDRRGVWTEHVEAIKRQGGGNLSVKPKLMGSEISGVNDNAIERFLSALFFNCKQGDKIQRLTVLKTGVEVFQRNLDAILKEVSEFELLIDKDGKPHIIDMAGEDPTAKASKDEAQIVEGLKNLLQAIETNLKELNTSQDKPR